MHLWNRPPPANTDVTVDALAEVVGLEAEANGLPSPDPDEPETQAAAAVQVQAPPPEALAPTAPAR